jgi:hypothetical protein
VGWLSGKLTRPLVRRAAIVIGVLTSVDVVLWMLRGEEALYRDTPAMARMGMAHLRPPGHCYPGGNDIVVLNDEHGPPEPSVMRELREVYALYGCTLYSEAEFPRGPITNTGCPSCRAFAYGVDVNTPVFAQLYTQQFLYSGGASVFRHRRLWLFGVWLPIRDDFVGQE